MQTRWKRAATVLVDQTCRLAGRERVVRASRFVMRRAKLDVQNDMDSNGEALLQHVVLRSHGVDDSPVILDVGANIGEWSVNLLDIAGRIGCRTPRLHAFEPSTFTHEQLVDALAGTTACVHQLAMSDHRGAMTLHLVGDGAGTNSLHANSHRVPTVGVEEVRVETVDDFCRDHDVDRIDLLKVDTEGHDYLVIAGATTMFRANSISVAQFEYNHRWIAARHYLRDVFDLLAPLGYSIGKLTPNGVEAYPAGWDPELETFVEANFVAWLPEDLMELPLITWWKSG